ncbi:hypothetical protein [Formosa sp. 4Alg 33]|uniref:hypothetical protein n=1 Tax=Formosa sp. 4Alg 33 TaxID=3382189 RepID=UPI003D9C3E67
MKNIRELKENISDLKKEKEKLLLELKDKSIANKKAILFASHYSYLNKGSRQVVLLISTFILGIILMSITGSGLIFFMPYFLWIGLDIFRMDDLIKNVNDRITTRINEVDSLLNSQVKEKEKHMRVKEVMGYSKKFLEKFNKKAS